MNKILFTFVIVSLACTVSANDQKMSRQEVLTTFHEYVVINEDFLSSVGIGKGKSGKTYDVLRKEVEAYAEGPFYNALLSAQHIVCGQKDKKVLTDLFKVMLATSNSADESPAWTLGEMFVCQPSLVEKEMARLHPAERKQIYDYLEFGFENVATTKPKDDKRALQLRKRITAMTPATLKKIAIQFDSEKEKQLQIEVDKGHQPWRLEPVEVAHAALIAKMNITVPYEKCKLSSEGDREAIVNCKDSKNYIVRLKQLVQEKGIWTAIEIQVIE